MHVREAKGGDPVAAGWAGKGVQGQPAGLTHGHVKLLNAGLVLTPQICDWHGFHPQHWLQPGQPRGVGASS